MTTNQVENNLKWNSIGQISFALWKSKTLIFGRVFYAFSPHTRFAKSDASVDIFLRMTFATGS